MPHAIHTGTVGLGAVPMLAHGSIESVETQNTFQRAMLNNSRLKIPVQFHTETLHGGGSNTTAFPAPVMQGKSSLRVWSTCCTGVPTLDVAILMITTAEVLSCCKLYLIHPLSLRFNLTLPLRLPKTAHNHHNHATYTQPAHNPSHTCTHTHTHMLLSETIRCDVGSRPRARGCCCNCGGGACMRRYPWVFAGD